MPVFVGSGLERVRVPMSDVLEVVRIRAHAEYAGIRFRMGAMWRERREYVREPIPFASADVTVLLWSDGPDSGEIAERVPGAMFDVHRDTRVSVHAKVCDVTNYEKNVEALTIGTNHVR